MSDAPLMIGVSGLRGIVGESLTPEVVMRYARAIGAWLDHEDPHQDYETIAIAHDGRTGHEVIYQAAIAGLLGSGWRVIPLGRAMTPTVGHFVDNYRADELERPPAAGVVVTASHNPAEWNGLKCISAIHNPPGTPLHDRYSRDSACAPPEWAAAEIIRRYNEQDFVRALFPLSIGTPHEGPAQFREATLDPPKRNATDCHARAVRDALWRPKTDAAFEAAPKRKYIVVVDSVNASGSTAGQRLFAQFRKDEDTFTVYLIQLHGDNSGIFPHIPEPTADNLSGEDSLCEKVPVMQADIGFAQDPDGDRLAIVDETGQYIGEEYTLALCARSVLEPMYDAGESSNKAVLCTNLSTSRMIDDVADMYGATVVRTAVGEANVVEAMKKLAREGKDVVLGGEGNGGVIWPKVTYVRDSLGSMALVLSLMARSGKTVSELVADVPSYAIVKRKQPLAKKEDAQPTIEKLAERYKSERVDRQDGVRVDFDAAKAWVHVRASNTEPILRLIAEAPTEELAESVLDEVQKLVDAG